MDHAGILERLRIGSHAPASNKTASITTVKPMRGIRCWTISAISISLIIFGGKNNRMKWGYAEVERVIIAGDTM